MFRGSKAPIAVTGDQQQKRPFVSQSSICNSCKHLAGHCGKQVDPGQQYVFIALLTSFPWHINLGLGKGKCVLLLSA